MFEERDYASENDPKNHGDVKGGQPGTNNMKDRWCVSLGSLGLGQNPVDRSQPRDRFTRFTGHPLKCGDTDGIFD